LLNAWKQAGQSKRRLQNILLVPPSNHCGKIYREPGKVVVAGFEAQIATVGTDDFAG